MTTTSFASHFSAPAGCQRRQGRLSTTSRGLGLLLLSLVALPPSAAAQGGWVKGSYLDASCPPFVFLAQPVTQIKFGIDVTEQLNLGDPGRQLMFMDHRLSQPVLLFPRPSHRRSLINSPRLKDGSVTEPSVYHDRIRGQFWVFFSYGNDVRNPDVTRPCEVYAINVTDAVKSPQSFDPDALPASRITHSPNTVGKVLSQSFNPTWVSQSFWSNGLARNPAVNQTPVVVDEEHGPVLYFASNERRAGGFGLQASDLHFTQTSVSMESSRPIQHFGTTSMVGFFESPGGCAGSYLSSVESRGQWSIFEFGSDEGLWTPISGYANGTNVADHGGTTIAASSDPGKSHVVVTRYYVNNNQGVGSLLILPYEKRGLNIDNKGQTIEQAGLWNLFPDIDPDQDRPSYVGKFALPAAGRITPFAKGIGGRPSSSTGGVGALRDVELFATYSAGCSNLRQSACAVPFHLTLVALTDLSNPIHPKEGFGSQNSTSFSNPAYDESKGVYGVLKHREMHCFAMKPLIGHSERFAWSHRSVEPLPSKLDAVAAHYPGLADMPVAQVAAGPLYKTDVRPYGRRGSTYDPTTITRNGSINRVELLTACLTKDMAPETLKAGDIAGMRIFITDPKVRNLYYGGNRRIHENSGWGYLHHDGSGRPKNDSDGVERERVRLLSDVPVESDGSISFLLPANLPVRFNLVHKDGTVLAAHRAHHSFAPGQLDKRCAGCHNHQAEGQVSTAGLRAFQSGYRPFDTLRTTGKFGWDSRGKTVFTTTPKPTLPVLEWKSDIWPLMVAECASCHDSGRNPNGMGLAGFDMNMPIKQAVPVATATVARETAIWSYLNNYRFINRVVGAAKSPFTWYFTGLANDDEIRLDGETNAKYRARQGSQYWITTNVGGFNPHPGIQDRAAVYKVIEWIDAGAPIDHDHVGEGGQEINGGGVNYDGYQIAVSLQLDLATARQLTIGYWDVDSNVVQLDIYVNDILYQEHPVPQGVNGTEVINLPPGLPDDSQIRVQAIDENNNRSYTEKSIWKL